MADVLKQLKLQTAANSKRVVFPEADDPRIVEAANRLANEQLAIPILIDPPQGAELNSGVEVFRIPDESSRLDRCGEQLFENRQHKGLSREAAMETVSLDRLILGALLIRTGIADAGVAGSLATTAAVIRAGLYGIGTPPGCKLVSSFFLMQLASGQVVSFADCGIIPDPPAEQLAEIAISTADNHQKLTGEPARVAMLSFSTKGSAEHPAVDKVVEATRLAKSSRPDLNIDGELQFDAAFVPEVGQRKAKGSSVAGHANVFVFPDLNSGNIGYKIAQRIGGAQAIGPLVQGLQKPFMDLSRGCTVDDIVNVAIVAGCMA
ncbi:MAG: phosphate acetyltransferase [Pirellulaceae bacterium]